MTCPCGCTDHICDHGGFYVCDACPGGCHGTPIDVTEAAESVRAARVRYAETFLRFRIFAKSDGQAHQQAILETKDELTTLEARLFLAREALNRQ